MLFSSIPFLFYFLPIVLLLYFLVPFKLKNAVLLLASLVFYAWGEPKYVVLMIASILLFFFLWSCDWKGPGEEVEEGLAYGVYCLQPCAAGSI